MSERTLTVGEAVEEMSGLFTYLFAAASGLPFSVASAMLMSFLGGWLLSISPVVALTLCAVSVVIGGLTVFLLGRETRGQPFTETVAG